MTRRRRAGRTVCALSLLGALTLTGCADPGAAFPDDPDDSSTLDLDLAAGQYGRRVRSVENSGSIEVSVDVVTEAGGTITWADGPDGQGAIRLPRFDPSSSSPAAMIRIRPSDPDQLNPGTASFAFGVDVKLDRASSGSKRDNGDNVLQRGLFGTGAQFKIQIDKRVPSCMVTGDDGTVLVKGPDELDGSSWYRIRCERDGDTVALDVTRLDPGGEDDTITTTETGSIGSVEFASTVPISVGGKITPEGTPAAATDQFNELLSGVHYSAGS